MKNYKHILLAVLLVLSLALIERIQSRWVYLIFSYPAGYLSSVFLGARMIIASDQQIWIPLANKPILISSACSGVAFFCILFSIVMLNLFRCKSSKNIFLYVLAAVPAVYLITVLTNTCRIICAYQAYRWAQLFLPANFQAAVHQGVGVVVFLSVCLVTSYILERVVRNV